jgi:NAD(P)-dependent dehydrogenase (short-subunit alcohol dehydrogenase family)
MEERLAIEQRLDGKVALVTGGSKGIGFGIAQAFALAGAQVMITSRKPDGCEAAATEIGHGVQWFASNVGEPEQAEACVDHTLEQFGRIDVLVNNAAANPYAGPTIDVDLSRWEKTLKVNITGPLVWSQLVWNKSMKESHGGCSIINISSVGGLATNPILGVYDVTKAALIKLTEQLAAELGPKVRVNAIAPGLVKTDFARVLWEDGRGDLVAQRYPAGRLGEPEDIGAAALWLAAESGRWVTGITVVMDGGGLVAFRDVG